jgi:hypothetical protein
MVILNNFAILSTLAAFVVVMSLTTTVEAQQNATGPNGPEFIAIQHAESASISEINATNYLLELGDLSDKTILFSNRPDRIVVTESINDFVGNWTEGKDSFQLDPPNAALVTLVGDGEQDIFEVELFNPIYNKEHKSLTYDVTFLGNITIKSDLPKDLKNPVLVIDSFPTTVNDQITDAVTQTVTILPH